ncbi:MAG: ribonuclease HII [bacterium]|nr:ribonuclease HII [bacterium]
MKYPNLNEEKKLRKRGYKKVACLDEAGRGSLAGPVVAAAVLIKKFPISNSPRRNPAFGGILRGRQFSKIKDSKKLSAKKREELCKILTKNPQIEWGIGRVSEKVIDKINILEATKLAMIKAIKKLKRKPDFLILDGNFTLPAEALAKAGIKTSIPQKPIIKADEKVFSCSAASILAKVTRDRIMVRYHKKYPQYRFDMHKGYSTKYHCKMIRKHGPCKIHRKTFYPVKTCKLK